MPAEKTPLDRVYGEMIYSLLTEMHGSQAVQLRAVNNNIASNQRTMLDLQTAINHLITSLKETRDKRYQEEIDSLELQMDNLKKQLLEKKNAKSTTATTSEKMEAIALNVITQHDQAEQKRKQIDWIDVRNKAVTYIVGAIALIFVLSLIPQFGQWLVALFAPK
jgi:chromosome segregation ATPase